DRGGEQADADVDTGGRGRDRAGERYVCQRITGEHLRAEHDEVANQPTRKGEGGPGQERVTDELLGEHHAPACANRERRRSGTGWSMIARGMRARRKTANPTVVM